MNEILTCKDFDGECCTTCHDSVDQGYKQMMEVLDKDNNKTYAEVCCLKVSQAEFRRDTSVTNTN